MKKLTLIGLLSFALAALGCDGSEAVPPAAAQTSVSAISVDASGFHPSSVHAPPNRQAHLVFTRTSDEGCGQQVVFPSLGIRKDLPLNTAVAVDFQMPASGSVAFTCGMGMLRGAVVVQ